MSDNKNIVNSRLNDIGCFFEKMLMQKENGVGLITCYYVEYG